MFVLKTKRAVLKTCLRAAAVAALFMAIATPASAAITIFSASVFEQSGDVANAALATKPTDGAAAIVGDGGVLTLAFNHPLTGEGVSLDLLAVTGANVIAISIGEIVGGVATFSGEFVLVDFGGGESLSADLTSQCATVSLTGCSLLRVRNAGALLGSTGFALDGISGVTNAPEPGVWALMIVGFAIVGWRLKTARGRIMQKNAFFAEAPPNFHMRRHCNV